VTGRERRRALGQHFLRDARVARAIADAATPGASDLVVEVGPGQGALTGELARRAGRLVVLELDRTLLPALRARFPGVEVLEADARSWDYRALIRPPGGRVLVVANLPYSAGTAILMAMARARGAIDEMVVMLQREVAERVAAVPGSKSYGSLSVLVQLGWEAAVILHVPPGAFRPPPKVESAVLHLRALPGPRVIVADEGHFQRVVRAAFSQRRKTLANSLAAGLSLPVARVREYLLAAGIDPGRRAETLDLAEFARLAAGLPGVRHGSDEGPEAQCAPPAASDGDG
jgi:16S rRNA (adenine1518-N6/adenine1519-N6)-dimethyltransferase